jgi:hypothetical protein
MQTRLKKIQTALSSEGPYLALVFLLILILYGPTILGSKTQVGIDLHTFSLPQYELFAELIQSKELPAWNPYLGQGSPLIGDSSFPLFYPLNLLLFFVSPQTLLILFPIIHLFFLYLGTYLLARTLKLKPNAAALAALTFTGGGVAVSQTFTTMYLGGCTWIPWALICFLKCLRSSSYRGLYFVSAALCFSLMFLVGALEYCAMTGILALLFGLVLEPRRGRTILALSLLTVLTMALCALVLWPMLNLLPYTDRGAGLSLVRAGRWSFAPLELLGLVVPKVFGCKLLPLEWVTSYAHRTWFLSIYCGCVPFVFMIQGCTRFFEDQRARLCALIVVCFLPFAFGIFTPVYLTAYELVPAIRSMRYPAKLFMPVFLALSLLAGIGFEHGFKSKLWRRVISTLLTLTILALVIAAANDDLALLKKLAFPLATCLCVIYCLGRAPRSKLRTYLIVLTLLDIALAAHTVLLFSPRELFDGTPTIVPVLRSLKSKAPIRLSHLSGIKKIAFGGDQTTAEAMKKDFSVRQSLQLNSGMAHKIGGVQVFSPLKSRRWSVLWYGAHAAGCTELFRDRLFGISHAIFTDVDDPSQVKALKMIAEHGPWKIGSFRYAAPWAAVYKRVSASKTLKESVNKIVQSSFDPRNEVVIEGVESSQWPRASTGTVSLQKYSWDTIELETQSSEDAYAVVRESWHPHWTAFVDGQKQPIYPADAIFRAVPVPKGKHTLVMKYECPGWRLGLWISALSGILVLIIGARSIFVATVRPKQSSSN